MIETEEKRLRESRIPSVTLLGAAFKRTRTQLASWFGHDSDSASGAPAGAAEGREDRWRPEYVGEGAGGGASGGRGLGRISRAADGRFVLADSSASASSSCSSDDGGFLARRERRRASWRRPLVGCPSQLSLRSDGSGESALGGLAAFLGALGTGGGLRTLQLPRPRPPLVPAIYSPAPPPVALSPAPAFTPRLRASSPATSGSLLTTAWSPSYNFSDLSSVRQPSSLERTLRSNTLTPPSYLQLRSVHERYSQELPSLRAIHEESSAGWTRTVRRRPPDALRPPPPPPPPPPALFLPVHPLATSSPPRVRIPPPQLYQATARPRARLPPRHARHARSAPELAGSGAGPAGAEAGSGASGPADVVGDTLMETSPSSSSGFGSKNTSQQNHSSQSGSTSAEWRLPPYRPPPPPPPPRIPAIQTLPTEARPLQPVEPSPLVGRWLAFAAGLQSVSPPHSEPGPSKPLDASVDDHYEFDTIFAGTPSPSTPRMTEQEPSGEGRVISDSEIYAASFYPSRPKRLSKYENIEARVQAMKEEFHEFRKRQANRRRSEELESAC